MLRPELETIEMVRAERESLLAELRTLRERLYSTSADFLRARAGFWQALSAFVRRASAGDVDGAALVVAADEMCAVAAALHAQRRQARADVRRCRKALTASHEQLDACGHLDGGGWGQCDYCDDARALVLEALADTVEYEK